MFVGWVLGPSRILGECGCDAGGAGLPWRLYVVMVKYVAPLLVCAILVSEVCRTLGLGGWSI